MAKKSLEIDCVAGSELRDTQGETLSVEGCDISALEKGMGIWTDNHGKGFFNTIGRITYGKKIFKAEDCTDDRQRYYWDRIKVPFIYAKGYLYDDDDHPNARAAAAVVRNIHKSDSPLKMKASVEGGVIARGLRDHSYLARTKLRGVALTLTPANEATLVEPLNMEKSAYDSAADMVLINSIVHLAETNVPSFRHITRDAQAEKIEQNVNKILELMGEDGRALKKALIEDSLESKIEENVKRIHSLAKALTAGYGGAGAPTNLTGGGVMQKESSNDVKLRFITCDNCGKEQVYGKFQVKCRECGKNFSMEKLEKFFRT